MALYHSVKYTVPLVVNTGKSNIRCRTKFPKTRGSDSDGDDSES